MRWSHAAAAWMFERLGLDAALAGDLLEECAQGRSKLWYWRQVLIAIWIGIWQAVFDHKVLALRAVATGCVVNGVWYFLWVKFHLPFVNFRLSMESVVSLCLVLFLSAVTGWVLARTHRAQAIPMVLVFAAWVVGCTLARDSSEVGRLLVNSMDQPRFRPYLVWHLSPLFTQVVGLLIGGVAGARPKEATSSPTYPEGI